jgi:hypothetical protein
MHADHRTTLAWPKALGAQQASSFVAAAELSLRQLSLKASEAANLGCDGRVYFIFLWIQMLDNESPEAKVP